MHLDLQRLLLLLQMVLVRLLKRFLGVFAGTARIVLRHDCLRHRLALLLEAVGLTHELGLGGGERCCVIQVGRGAIALFLS